ncbi:Hypothetical predicted protein [Paramuricea clavata]|uniref:Uncharacterized protein n=1 Tax=Paramuricea clavata TaxID=317549 RepID=A0A7D9H9W6_PARCT|nr:Hypothetical predicted protein [Paramuricea clavata]
MSRSGVPFVDELSAPQDDLHFNVPELLIQPPTPRLPSDAIAVPWSTSRHLSVGSLPTMHTSQSAPTATYLADQPLTRDRRSRSQSVPLSLNVVAYTKKLVNVSDIFEAKNQAVKMRGKERSRTLSGSELSRTDSHPRRHSDLVEQWMKERDVFSPKIGSPV